MSYPSGADLIDSRGVQIPGSDLDHSNANGSDPNPRPEKMYPHNEEYMKVLQKHLGVVESELSRLKDTQVTEPVMNEGSNYDHELKASETGMQTQEARIYRVPPWAWREVKNQLGINPKLPTLIASSKGHGRAGPRSVRRKTSSVDSSYHTEEPSLNVAYRLAINSRILLNLLGDCTGMDFPEDRNVWLRPFKYLVAYEAEIRQALQEAEETLVKVNVRLVLSKQVEITNQDEASLQSAQPAQGSGEANAGGEYTLHVNAMDVSRAKAERDQLRCLVEFMSSDMQDIFDVKHQVATQILEEIAFEHLWLLYKPGDLVYTTNLPEERNTYQAYRVIHVTGGRSILDTRNSCSFDSIDDRSWEDESETEEKVRDSIRSSPANTTPFMIDCFKIDYDGNRVGPKSKRFAISTFNGKRKLDTLEPRPPYSFPQHENLQRELVERGRRFTQLANGIHQRYSGTTVRESRELWERNMNYYNYTIHDEEIHSEVMLDQSAAVTHFRKAFEKWRLKIGGRIIGVPTAADRREVFDPLPNKQDKDLSSDVFDDSIIDLDRRNDFASSTMLLKYHRDILDPSLSDDYVMLLPFRIYGYAMLNRKYFPFNINLVHDITPDQMRITAAGYEDLVLPDGHKRLLQAIVKNQVRDSQQICSGRDEDPDDFQMDVVKGKGKGLIILLHGAPGVGKTSTAECVAAQLKRPLLPITCGDISTYVKQAEDTLREYCALAHRWRCVLLLDEADVFLARREKGDITRNGLVSDQLGVFLRVLEYFSGVIILTTNRVGEFDEAFRSRIHVSLYYPKLDRDATMQIWERSLLRLRRPGYRIDFSEDEIRNFAEQHWLSNVKRPSRHWNGRQIKNAFQTALALANWEFYEMKQGQHLERPLLKANHFDRVARTSDHFDDYISDIHNISEDTYSVLAARAEIRNDTHPAMSSGRSTSQEFVPHSKRAASTRRGAGNRGSRVDEDSGAEGSSTNAKVRELELKLRIMELQQASGKEGVQALAGSKDDDNEEEGW